MRLYCKDFDEKKCVYEEKYSNLGGFCGLSTVEEEWLHRQVGRRKASICGASLSFEQYITKFEWLMIKELKEK